MCEDTCNFPMLCGHDIISKKARRSRLSRARQGSSMRAFWAGGLLYLWPCFTGGYSYNGEPVMDPRRFFIDR
jgi:hypothetical protein